MEFKAQWNIDMAMAVLASETVDSQTWADAVKWLLLYGPPKLREMLLAASASATGMQFPELRPAGYTEEGEPLYPVDGVAAVLGVDPGELEDFVRKLDDGDDEERPWYTLHKAN